MRISEQKTLKSAILEIKKHTKKFPYANDFYNKLDLLNDLSLQSQSLKKDLKFFEEIKLIISVITSIVSHPFILNKGEDTIIRADLAGHIEPQMLQKTLKDSSLWRRRRGEMIPESVHHHENVDEIVIYENIFIVMLINLLDNEIKKYQEFYINVIQKFDFKTPLILKSDYEEVAILEIERLLKRIRNIRETYFYKTVSKHRPIEGHIVPTNILKKNRLYNLCYKFYLKMITYKDKGSLMDDLSLYYYIKLIKNLKDLGFKMNLKTKKTLLALNKRGSINLSNQLEFLSGEFKISICKHKYLDAIEVKVINRNIKDKLINSANHLLMIETNNDFMLIDSNMRKVLDNYDTIEAISVWNLAYIEYDFNQAFENTYNEYTLINKWLESKISQTSASKEVYSHYCPVCKKKHIEDDNGLLHCSECDTKYTFYEVDQNEVLWLIKIGRC